MARPWLWLPAGDWDGDVALPVDESHHALKVLRLGIGEEVVVADGAGRVGRARLASATKERVAVRVDSREDRPAPTPALRVYQAVSKGHKLDGVVQRLAELGVSELHVWRARRSVPRWDGGRAAKVQERLQAIARASGKQSRHAHWLKVSLRGEAEDIASDSGGTKIVLWEGATHPLRAALPTETPDSVAVVVGPEGGLEEAEVATLCDLGARAVTLGEGILRTENAAPIASALILYQYEVIG